VNDSGMLTVAYLANQFPSPVEPYVTDEILELRRRGVRVIAGSVRKAGAGEAEAAGWKCSPEIVLQTIHIRLIVGAAWLCLTRGPRILTLLARVLFRGTEPLTQRVKAMAHTFLGAYYAAALSKRGVSHIHVHHGYFGSWIGMVAAKLLGISYSLTLHGSDLLLHARYLDTKIGECRFCVTVSEYNRGQILEHYSQNDPGKIVVCRLGVELEPLLSLTTPKRLSPVFELLSAGRLHPVKDHAFLVKACAALRAQGVNLHCLIAGEGPERAHLESLIRKLELEAMVELLGHVPREHLDFLLDQADLVVLTSRSEGIPLFLMEAMARGKLVLAPNITGIPELVIDGKTGFLFEPGREHSFVNRILSIRTGLFATATGEHRSRGGDVKPNSPGVAGRTRTGFDWIRHAARSHVLHNFNRPSNLESFSDLFTERVAPQIESPSREDLVLQQI
jgi:colanic acid/amylovoran biosynthesis glycosyltransferase